jgi:DNA-binding NarL/FixJ family response regulator
MSSRRPSRIPKLVLPDDAFPLDAAMWQRLVEALRLPPRQVQIAEQVLLGRQDKEIVDRLGIARSTLRTHLDELFDRTDSVDRTELVSRLCSAAELQRRGASDSSIWRTA